MFFLLHGEINSTKAKGGNRDDIERYDTHKGDATRVPDEVAYGIYEWFSSQLNTLLHIIRPDKTPLILALSAYNSKTNSVTPILFYRIVISMRRCNVLQMLKKFCEGGSEPPCLCPFEGHKHGGRKVTETSVIKFCY